MKKIKGGILAPKGYKAAGVAAGLKSGGALDMAMVVSDVPASAAMVVTQNAVKAAPVLLDCELMAKHDRIGGVVINSKNANACTGEQGEKDALAMSKKASQVLGFDAHLPMLVSSTGVIGELMPMDKINAGIKALSKELTADYSGGEAAAKAIMTTDTKPKTIAISLDVGGVEVHIGAMAKGSGMICPNMATMLCYITTDCNITKSCLNALLSEVTEDTFNMLSIDGDMSTNDTVVLMANGLAANPKINSSETLGYISFKNALEDVCKNLTKALAGDGEGATKLLEVTVRGAASKKDARCIAKTIVDSNLIKTALFGEDANWGRVMMAAGASGASFNPKTISLTFSSNVGMLTLLNEGTAIPFDEDNAKRILSADKILINLELTEGSEKATAWGCDLSYDYVKINGDYRT